ncbi:MAG: hypothetical protein GX146_01575 [Myxococcales bacterium]|nr:hypothetical protein [Myxococcales bacterium]
MRIKRRVMFALIVVYLLLCPVACQNDSTKKGSDKGVVFDSDNFLNNLQPSSDSGVTTDTSDIDSDKGPKADSDTTVIADTSDTADTADTADSDTNVDTGTPECTPGEARCPTTDAVQVCVAVGDAGAQWASPVDCSSGQMCVDALGACVDCVPGTYECYGQNLYECNTRGSWSSAVTCDTNKVCVEALGACVDCTPGTYKCEGQELYGCDSTGSWVSVSTCYSSDICDPVQGRCVSFNLHKMDETFELLPQNRCATPCDTGDVDLDALLDMAAGFRMA